MIELTCKECGETFSIPKYIISDFKMLSENHPLYNFYKRKINMCSKCISNYIDHVIKYDLSGIINIVGEENG